MTLLSQNYVPHEELIIGSRLREALAGVPGVGYFKLDHMTVPDARKCRVLVTGNSDYPVDAQTFTAFVHPGLTHWFGQFATHADPRLTGRPIGHQEPVTEILGNVRAITDKAQETKHNRGLAYIGWRDSTYQHLRANVRAMYEGEPWVTFHPWQRDEEGYARYLDGLYSHKFVLCPRGNGAGTIRFWDTLVLRSIPIMARSQAMSYFEDLPVLWLDDWRTDLLTPERLEREYERIMNTDYDLRPLTLSYWVERIMEAAK